MSAPILRRSARIAAKAAAAAAAHPPSLEKKPVKILLVGDAGVGKTALVSQLKRNPFHQKYVVTFGAEAHPMFYGNNLSYTLWDVGASTTPSNLSAYTQNANLAILVFDLTRKRTHEALESWYNKLRALPEGGSLPVIVLGNKSDCTEERIAEKEITFHLKKRLPYFEVSAKTGENVQSLLDYFFWTTGHI